MLYKARPSEAGMRTMELWGGMVMLLRLPLQKQSPRCFYTARHVVTWRQVPWSGYPLRYRLGLCLFWAPVQYTAPCCPRGVCIQQSKSSDTPAAYVAHLAERATWHERAWCVSLSGLGVAPPPKWATWQWPMRPFSMSRLEGAGAVEMALSCIAQVLGTVFHAALVLSVTMPAYVSLVRLQANYTPTTIALPDAVPSASQAPGRRGVLAVFRRSLHNEGWRGLYTGTAIAFVQIVAKSLLLLLVVRQTDEDETVSLVQFMAGSLCIVLMDLPFEVVLQRYVFVTYTAPSRMTPPYPGAHP